MYWLSCHVKQVKLQCSAPFQDGTAKPAVPPLPGGGNLPIQSHLGHVADSKPDGTVQNRLQRSSALDERRISGTRSRHSQADGEIPQGWSPLDFGKGVNLMPL